MLNSNAYLLDTHVFLWLIDGNKRFKQIQEFNTIIKAAEKSGLRVSVISLWEIAMLEAKGRLKFTVDIFDWIDQALAAPGIVCEPITPHVAIASTRLPGNFHGDPADRIIVATARRLQCPLITADREILAYADEGYLKAIKI